MNERGMRVPRSGGRGTDIETCTPSECEAGRSEVAA
ncbi:hypothetical protein SAMN05428945_2736 [Streptomyces sp. 2224.1]|nr:hypothetical protein BX261_2582 [Streptomyces sp. 2321.6]SDR48070.1 hypothetical protein SAMN05216511_4621 [Streptomyces sp. KS_16]SEC37686.1 hypothetical protein SAMN05428945_2736 [Streptomyces sp. 2224.1]SEC67256.1 hypothetical protein SAMN05428940_2585 [Streptomyces sp. 2133.1]SEE94045.1 hypothetical protein SAMN05428954_4659 [Streptomyces sp. 2112.3]SNC68749.1 hypothetical protein SAMN06272741_2578 [Streptomyces sp. 2114.4]